MLYQRQGWILAAIVVSYSPMTRTYRAEIFRASFQEWPRVAEFFANAHGLMGAEAPTIKRLGLPGTGADTASGRGGRLAAYLRGDSFQGV
jgi:hypothetical protein